MMVFTNALSNPQINNNQFQQMKNSFTNKYIITWINIIIFHFFSAFVDQTVKSLETPDTNVT